MHTDHMLHSGGTEWISMLLALVFAGGALFYLFRLLSPAYVRTVTGYHDKENEFWHGACLTGMVACLMPGWFSWPDMVWLGLFGVGTVWYLVRAFTYGRRLTYNKQWYDFAHAAMLFGMAWMFANVVEHWLVTLLFAAYWLWFGSYYAYRLGLDFKTRASWLGFGQDTAHLIMAAVMLVMTVWPAALHHHARHDQAVLQPVSIQTRSSEVATIIGDSQFEAQVVKQEGKVVVLVSGGCQNCATEIPVFEEVARANATRAHFVRIHKDASPDACKWLSTKECPAVVIVENGKVTARLDGFAEHDALKQFVEQHLK